MESLNKDIEELFSKGPPYRELSYANLYITSKFQEDNLPAEDKNGFSIFRRVHYIAS